MNKESLFKAGAIIGALYITKELATTAFTPRVRKEILVRDQYTCKGIDNDTPCVWEEINGKPATWADGFMITASHWDHTKGPKYNKPETGRAQCTCCHYLFEIQIGETEHAELLDSGITIFTHYALENPESYPLLVEGIENVPDALNYIYQRKMEMEKTRAERVEKAKRLLTGQGQVRRIG